MTNFALVPMRKCYPKVLEVKKSYHVCRKEKHIQIVELDLVMATSTRPTFVRPADALSMPLIS